MNKYQEILKNWETPFDTTPEQAWKNLEPKLVKGTSKDGRVVIFNWKPLVSVASAAAILIVAVVFFWPKNELIQHETAQMQIESFILPDNSVATLNASSSIAYEDDWSDERTLKLEGQAFFEVVKGSNFSVVTPNGIVEVMGTSFDVFCRKNQFRVECHTGKVRVTSGKNKVEITPGNAAELSENGLELSRFDASDADWHDGEFVYHEEPLQNVLEEVARQFGVNIIMPDLSGRFYTGRFDTKSLEKALELVCIPMSLMFEIKENNQVIISEQTR